ncbi:MAG TPA: hypothetical protein VGK82_04540 [Pyrinomonadaceae bacterium]
MKYNNIIAAMTLMAVLITFTCFSPLVRAQTGTAPQARCSVEINSLKDGDKVGESVTVRGNATIPADGNLWLLAHKSSMGNQWWPQAGPIEIKNGEWQAEVFFGRSRDVGSNFEVAAVVVNHETNTALTKWFSTARTSDYPPVVFPDANSSCSVVKVTVVKTA